MSFDDRYRVVNGGNRKGRGEKKFALECKFCCQISVFAFVIVEYAFALMYETRLFYSEYKFIQYFGEERGKKFSIK